MNKKSECTRGRIPAERTGRVLEGEAQVTEIERVEAFSPKKIFDKVLIVLLSLRKHIYHHIYLLSIEIFTGPKRGCFLRQVCMRGSLESGRDSNDLGHFLVMPLIVSF